MKTVLVVDDEPKIIKLVRDYLERAGFGVLTSGDGKSALEMAKSARPDCIILDLGLPHMDGLDVTRELRKLSNVPIIMLTARSEEADKLVGLELGADDYITKPFSPKELVARLRALLRRARPSLAAGRIEIGELVLDTLAREVTLRDKKLALTRREFDLLAFLAHQPGRVHRREELLRKVWGYDFMGETRTVDVHVRRLRVKLGEKSHFIETVPGTGYKLVDPAAEKRK